MLKPFLLQIYKMEARSQLQRHSHVSSSGIFHFTETACSPEPIQLPVLLSSCNELQYTVASSSKHLSRDVRKALEQYNEAGKVMKRPFVRKWRSQARYSDGRNRILTLLSNRNKSHDEKSQETFNSLLFAKKAENRELAQQFQFTLPEVLTPRMLQFIQVHRRPFGSHFLSPALVRHPVVSSPSSDPDSVVDYLKSEIGKYHSDRMDRMLRIPRRKESLLGLVEMRSSPNSPARHRKSIMAEPIKPIHIDSRHIRHISEAQDVEQSLVMDIREVRRDMAGVYRAEKLLAGSQLMELGRLKAFKAGLKDVREPRG